MAKHSRTVKKTSGRGGARKNAGRPTRYPGKRSVAYMLTTDAQKILAKAAKKTNRSRNDFLEHLIREHAATCGDRLAADEPTGRRPARRGEVAIAAISPLPEA